MFVYIQLMLTKGLNLGFSIISLSKFTLPSVRLYGHVRRISNDLYEMGLVVYHRCIVCDMCFSGGERPHHRLAGVVLSGDSRIY